MIFILPDKSVGGVTNSVWQMHTHTAIYRSAYLPIVENLFSQASDSTLYTFQPVWTVERLHFIAHVVKLTLLFRNFCNNVVFLFSCFSTCSLSFMCGASETHPEAIFTYLKLHKGLSGGNFFIWISGKCLFRDFPKTQQQARQCGFVTCPQQCCAEQCSFTQCWA